MTNYRIIKTTALFSLVVLAFGLISYGAGKKGSLDNSKEIVYNNPLVKQRADPWVYKDADGTYYFTATAPDMTVLKFEKPKPLTGLPGLTLLLFGVNMIKESWVITFGLRSFIK